MIFESEGKRYRISFQHSVYQGMPVTKWLSGDARQIRGVTRCFLVELPPVEDGVKVEPIPVGEGVASCAVSDQFSKEKGRRVSLRRALEASWPDRHLLWGLAFTAYSNRKKKVEQYGGR